MKDSAVIWKLRRLAAMDSSEIAWRLRTTTANVWEANLLKLNMMPTQDIPMKQHSANPWTRRWPRLIDTKVYASAEAQITNGQFPLLGENFDVGFPPTWNKDPSSQKTLDLEFGPLMNLRQPARVGSIKHLWELNRHASVVVLGQSWVVHRKPQSLETLQTLLSSWIEQCPRMCGANWHSALEVALRLINWSTAWHLLELNDPASPARSYLSESFLQSWERSAFQHAKFIYKNLSQGSSANNHLFGELAGLFVASLTWSSWGDVADWKPFSLSQLEAQFLLQIEPDGTGVEQAFWYQYEMCDLMLFCILLGRTNQTFFDRQCLERLRLSIQFLRVAYAQGGLPMIGDSDDAHPIALGFVQSNDNDPIATLIACYDRFNRTIAIASDPKLCWLFGDRQTEKHPVDSHEVVLNDDKKNRMQWFDKGGYLVVHRKTSEGRAVKLIADAGSLGYLSIAAHGHADALSLNLHYGAIPLFVDPGTFSYKPNDPWRDWFRSTRAHNTVCIDGLDQSIIGGPFMWTKHAKARLEQFESARGNLLWSASHNGYGRLQDPVTHRRTIEWSATSDELFIHDDFVCESTHHYEWTWQCHPSWQCTLSDDSIQITHAQMQAIIRFPSGTRSSLYVGQVDCQGGWYSVNLGTRVPAPRIAVEATLSGSWRATTVIQLGSLK